MKHCLYLFAFLFIGTSLCAQKDSGLDLTAMSAHEGFVPFFYDQQTGKIYLALENLDEEFLYTVSLATGIGSNTIGLDRGRLGDSRVVKFNRVGDKIVLKEVNYGYRADSDNAMERLAVKEAFAESILWGFKVVEADGEATIVDATDFFLRDAYDVIGGLGRGHGSYRLDASRSFVYMPRTKNFPENTEIEATITVTGSPKGREVPSVVPDAKSITVRQHHSMVQLPDDNYSPREFDPRSGYMAMSFYDYATPINMPLVKKYIRRHRLEKKDPGAERSEAVEPIVYYLDPGVPEPIRSALLEGASWWNQAYEAAGYIDAFQVRMLPDDADPMDIRYNLIQWVHRSSRGWSYGSSVVDPRTGEIIKGKVTLGSLRVRQDYLIAQGLLAAFEDGRAVDGPLVDMSLARLRQLSAHEVGHTIGLVHNYIASADGRESVMDYPHPYIAMNNGQADFSAAYDDKIGGWDKRAVVWGYQDFPEGTNEQEALNAIIDETRSMGLRFLSDQDARPASSAHPLTHLWDNGTSPVEELMRMSAVRTEAMSNFGEHNVPEGTSLSYLEEVFVPLYFSHRYQVEGVTKMIGGLEYRYTMRGEDDVETSFVTADVQRSALDACLHTLSPEFLTIPEDIIRLIPPRAMGSRRGRELLKNQTGLTFDPVSAADAAAQYTLEFLLNPARMNRLMEQHARGSEFLSVEELLDELEEDLHQHVMNSQGLFKTTAEGVYMAFIEEVMRLARSAQAQHQVMGAGIALLHQVAERFAEDTSSHGLAIASRIRQYLDDPGEFILPAILDLPDGSPIGCGGDW